MLNLREAGRFSMIAPLANCFTRSMPMVNARGSFAHSRVDTRVRKELNALESRFILWEAERRELWKRVGVSEGQIKR